MSPSDEPEATRRSTALLRRLPTRNLLLAAAALLGVALLFVWAVPSRDYLFLPNTAEPLAPRVTVPGSTDAHPGGGIYFLDVSIRKATWLERFVAPARPDGATLVPSSVLTPTGGSLDDELAQGRTQMTRSQQVAAAVAFRTAGYSVKTVPNGVIVEAIAGDVPAAKVLREGDVIVAVNGEPTRTTAQLRREITAVAPGTTVQLAVRRDGKLRNLGVTTIASPSEPDRTLLGIAIAQDATITLPTEVKIDLGSVVGPSAGLPFALQVLDDLGEDVDRGLRVAATGEIELDGSVGPIGGVKQKTIGARRANADVLLVPAGDNAREALRYAGDMRVVPVKSFQQALQKLATLSSK
jgi:PDZ domain-containing protein